MKLLSSLLFITLSSNLFTLDIEAREFTDDEYVGAGILATSGSVLVTSKLIGKLKENKRNEIKSSIDVAHRMNRSTVPGNEGRYILEPQLSNDGKMLPLTQYGSKNEIARILDEAKDFESVTITYILGDQSSQHYFVRTMQREKQTLRNRIKAIQQKIDSFAVTLHSHVKRQEELIKEARKQIAQLDIDINEVKNMDNEAFLAKYKGHTRFPIKERIIKMDKEGMQELKDSLDKVSKKEHRLFEIRGHMSPEYYTNQARKNMNGLKVMIPISALSTIATTGAFINAYDDVFDGEVSTKDAFNTSSSSVEHAGSNGEQK